MTADEQRLLREIRELHKRSRYPARAGPNKDAHWCLRCRIGTQSPCDAYRLADALERAWQERDEARRYLATARREIDFVDAALPEWKCTGAGRIETIARVRRELAEARAAIQDAVEDALAEQARAEDVATPAEEDRDAD